MGDLPGLEPITDLGPAQWIVETLRPWDRDFLRVGTIVPPAFEAYVRILHPATRWNTVQRDRESQDVRWAEVAEWSGRLVGPSSGFDVVATRADGERWTRAAVPPWAHGQPMEGELSLEEALALGSVLAPFTGSERWWFALWEGWGWDLFRSGALADLPRLSPPAREYAVFTGPPEAVGGFLFNRPYDVYQSPALWWPEDRAWCVASEIDLWCTYVGASREAIDALLADERFETLEVSADDPSETGDDSWDR
jgi:hypothetical protein